MYTVHMKYTKNSEFLLMHFTCAIPEKFPYPHQGLGNRNSIGRGISLAKVFKGKYEA